MQSLTLEGETGLEEENLRFLLRSEKVQKLTLPQLDEDIVMLPFSAKVDHLDYEIKSSALLDGDVQSLNIVTQKLGFTIFEEGDAFPVEATLAFLRRLATLGHFVELKIRFTFDDDEMEVEIPDCVVQEVIRTALANPKLQVLDLTSCDDDIVSWERHVETLLQGLKDHKKLRTLKINVDEDAFGSDYSLLRQFLTDNRNVTVMNEEDEIYTDEADIDELYSLNRFYRGSADLVVTPSSERLSLVATALMETFSSDFQCSALLLSDHADVLYDLVHDVRVDELEDGLSDQRDTSKRRRRA
jgi:hypothetical protein